MSLFQIIIPLNISTQNYFGLKVIVAVSKSINSRDKFFTHNRYLFKIRWEVMSSYSNYKVIMKKRLTQITWVLSAIYPSLIAREVSSLFLTSEITPLFNFCCKLFLKIHYLESSVLKKYVIFSFLFFFTIQNTTNYFTISLVNIWTIWVAHDYQLLSDGFIVPALWWCLKIPIWVKFYQYLIYKFIEI